MDMDYTWKIGGVQGEGIDSTGEIFALTLHRMGHSRLLILAGGETPLAPPEPS